MSSARVLQIVPRLPGTLDGLGDYAMNIARVLSAHHGLTSVFLVAQQTTIPRVEGFEVLSGLQSAARPSSSAASCEHVLLHYVNYGYQARGVPFALRRFASELRAQLPGRWVTTFHEIYASGPPWRSEFWTRPFQVQIARDLIRLSDVCFASNGTVAAEIERHEHGKKVYLAPVMSNLGEPVITDFTAASPQRWAIFGGTDLVRRSLLSFENMWSSIPTAFSPSHIEVIGGRNEVTTRRICDQLAERIPGFVCRYHPEVAVQTASELLSQCSFAWLDYFGDGKVWPGMIMKSSVFAACAAHGIVPILSHEEEPFSVDGEAFPGPWFRTSRAARFPVAERLPEIREKIYNWYGAHAATPRLAQLYAEAFA